MAIAMYKDEGDGAFPLLWTTGQPEADISRSDSAGTIEELKTKLDGREAAMQNVRVIRWKLHFMAPLCVPVHS